MEELLNLLEELFNKDTRYHSKDEIKKLLKLKGEDQATILNKALLRLEEEGKIFFEKGKGFRIFPATAGFAFGELEINKAGTGFVHTSDGYTILIENDDFNGALNGDSVVVNNIFNKRKDYYSGKIYKIVKRKTGKVVFEAVNIDNDIKLIPYNTNDKINIKVNNNEIKNLIDGNIVFIKVGCNSEYGSFKGDFIKIIGHKDDPDIDIKLILEKNNIPIGFSKELMEEARKLPKSVTEEDIKNRVDLRCENIFTIDCDNTKDRDDAVGIKKLDNGNYLLKVNISHVSHYIKENSLLFQNALNKCYSYYLSNTCEPMFPHIISNGICSLNPNVDRLTRTVEMEIDKNGDIVNYNIYNSVINSKKAMSYSNVNKLLNGENIEDYNKYSNDLFLMKELNDILQNKREKRNYLDFKINEPISIEKDKKIIGFKNNDLGIAGEIIENFMIIANEIVYNNFSWFAIPYRVHDEPNEKKVKEIIDILRSSNIKIPKINNVTPSTLKGLLDNLDNSELSEIVREYLLRSMEKAKYSTINVGHFALQSDTYGHFTSPIRRVPDLLIHTIIDNIEKENVSEESYDKFYDLLHDTCIRANKLEITSKYMEEEATDMRMAEYMEDKIGKPFEVIVTYIGKNSILVRSNDLIRGKLKLENMLDDKYKYDSNTNSIIGKKTNNKYKIGSKILVLVKDASKKTRTVNFEIPKEKIKILDNKIS